MKVIDADALMTDICDSIDKMTEVGIPVDGEWLWAKLNHAIKHAPTIEPERKRGKWIRIKAGCYQCDQCGVVVTSGFSNFCHRCGAKMEGGK